MRQPQSVEEYLAEVDRRAEALKRFCRVLFWLLLTVLGLLWLLAPVVDRLLRF